MTRLVAAAAIVTLLLFVAGGCNRPSPGGSPSAPLPGGPASAPPDSGISGRPSGLTGYLLVGDNVHKTGKGNWLVLFDPGSMKVTRRVQLPTSRIKTFARDPQGRIWLGLAGDFDRDDNRVMVYSPAGDLLKTIQVGMVPQSGVAFTRGKAYVACIETGFGGAVTVIDLQTLAVRKSIPLADKPGRPFMLTAIGATEDTVAVAAATDPEQHPPGLDLGPFGTVVLIDPQTDEEVRRLNPPGPSAIWQILASPGGLLMLNNDWHALREPNTKVTPVNLLRLTKAGELSGADLPTLPFRGLTAVGKLYTLHRAWSAPVDDVHREVVITALQDLASGGTPRHQVIRLPDGFETRDLAVWRGRVYLTRGEYNSDAEDGLWRLDSPSGKLERVLPLDDASMVIMPEGD